jgi:hypothetical protein
VHERRRLQCLPRPLAADEMRRDTPQLVVDERRQAVGVAGRVVVAGHEPLGHQSAHYPARDGR